MPGHDVQVVAEAPELRPAGRRKQEPHFRDQSWLGGHGLQQPFEMGLAQEPVNRIRRFYGRGTLTGLPSPQVRKSANQSCEQSAAPYSAAELSASR